MKIEIRPQQHALRLAWLGMPLVWYGDQPVAFRTRKAMALLVYLTTERGIHRREKLTAFFWPESDSARGRNMLRTTLAYLREALQPVEPTCLLIEPQSLGFDFASHINLDLHPLQASLDALHAPPEQAARGQLIRQLQQAVRLYRGDFLEGFSLADAPAFDDWATLQREHWHRRMGQVFDTLSQWQFEAGDLSAAVATAQRWRAHDRYGEQAPHRLLQLHFANGNRTDALQIYDEYAKMLEIEFNGKPSPAIKTLVARIRAKTPTRSEPAQTAPPLALADLTFVGRANELTRLMAAYGAACAGQTQVVILEGEAGIGKTRLAAEFLRRVTAQGADILTGRAFETGGELPYQPLAQLLRHQLEQEQVLTDLLSPIWLAELSRLLPEVRERHPDLPQPDANEATAQSRLIESITRFGGALADRAPLVLFIDDLQWADLPSLDALQYALTQWTGRKTTLLLLLGTRHIAASDKHNLRHWVASLKAKLAVTHMTLAPLTVEETLALVASLEGVQAERSRKAADHFITASVPMNNPTRGSVFQAFAQALFDETGGQPLYLVETIKSLLEQKLLTSYHTAAGGSDVRWQTLPGEPTVKFSLPRSIPGSVRAAILDRLARLTPAASSLLGAAAVLGQATTFEQLAAISGLEEMLALDALEELVTKQLLVESSQTTASYLVAHDKIRDVVYDECSTVRRKILHRRTVAALQADDPARIAYHALAAGMAAEAFRYSIVAGDAALHLFAAREAIVHYESARKLITTEKLPAVEIDGLQQLYLNLGHALELNAQFEQAEIVYEELKTIAQQRAADSVTLAALTAQVLLRSVGSESFDPVQGNTLAQTALQLAHRLNDPIAETKILWGLMNIHLLSNCVDEALRFGDQALGLAYRFNLQEQTAFILNDRVKCLLIGGNLDQAEQSARQASELWRSLNNLPMLADSLASSANIARWQGNYDQAFTWSAEAYKISQSIEYVWGQAYSQMTIGCVLWERGQPQEAITVMEECIRLAEQANSLLPQILTRADLGATYISSGDIERGFAYLHQALKLAETRLPMFSPYVIGLLARQYLLWDQLDEAEAMIQRAKTEQNQQFRSFLLQWVRVAEAELALRLGNFEYLLDVTNGSLEAIRQSGMCSLLPRVLAVRGYCFAAMGQREMAQATLFEAQTEAEKSGARWWLGKILEANAKLEPDPVQAAQLWQQAQAIIAYICSHSPPELRAMLQEQ